MSPVKAYGTGGANETPCISYDMQGIKMQDTTHPNGRSTSDVARANGVKPESVLAQFYRKGSYCGMKPIGRLSNGRLVWPDDSTTTK